MPSFRTRMSKGHRVTDRDREKKFGVDRAQQQLRMKAAGRRIMVLNQVLEDEAAEAAVAAGGAAFRIGQKAAALTKSMRKVNSDEAKTKPRGCCHKTAKQCIFGKDESVVQRSRSYEEGGGQTKLEKRATAAIEGLHKDGVSVFSDDHQLAMKTDALCDLVIKREAVLDDMALRVVAKHDIFTGGFYMFFFLLFFWVVVDQMQVWKRYDLETAMKQYASEGPSGGGSDGGSSSGRRGGADAESEVSEVKSVDDVFPWLENVIVGSVFPPNVWYNGDPYTDDEIGFLLNFNRLVGGFQLVQKRVAANVNCPIDDRFGDWAGDCFPAYGEDWQQKESFGPPHDPTKYEWTKDAGAVTDEWAGYKVLFPLDRKLAQRLIVELQQDRFLDKETRELRIDYTVYNQNKQLFCAVTYVLEFLDSGLVKQDLVVNSIHIESYEKFTFRHFCEFLIVLKVFLQMYDELHEAWNSGIIAYYQSIWNWIDTLRIGFFITCITCYVQMLLDPISRELELPLPPGQIFVDFSNLNILTRTYVRRCAVTILMCLMSVLKYMRHSQTYGTLAITLTYAGAEIVRFLLMFSLVNLTFTVMGMLMFGNALEDFHTVTSSVQTLMMMMTGEYGYQNLQVVDERSALTFYSFYVILVFFILVNMFLAIVFDGYAMLQESRSEEVQFPYRYSYVQEEMLELRRDFATRWPRWCSRVHPHQFFLTTEEIHALLADPIKLGRADIGEKRVVCDDKVDNHRHIVHANSEVETIITREDMLDLGWSESHIRWLLSQVGVPPDDDAAENDDIVEVRHSIGRTANARRHQRTENKNVTAAYTRSSIPLHNAVELIRNSHGGQRASYPSNEGPASTLLSPAAAAATAAGATLPGAVSLEDELSDLGFDVTEPAEDKPKVHWLPPISEGAHKKHSEQAIKDTAEAPADLTRRGVGENGGQHDLLVARVTKMTFDIQSQLSEMAAKVEQSNQEMKEQIANLTLLLRPENSLAEGP